MTRIEEIQQAANDYLQSEGLQCNFTEDNYAAGVFDGIIAGALWADEHPKSPWISVKDRLPERMTSRDRNGAEIIYCCSKNVFGYDAWNRISRLVCYNHGSEEWESRDDYRIGKITHWMPTIARPEQEAEHV